MWFLNKYKLLSPNLVGFQSALCTNDALLFIEHIISKNRSTRNNTSILSIDFLKAFDNIGIHVVLNKLSDWKMGPKMFNYIKSFLTNRKFMAKVTLFIIAFDDLSYLPFQNKDTSLHLC